MPHTARHGSGSNWSGNQSGPDDDSNSGVPPSDAYVGDDGDESYDPPSGPTGGGANEDTGSTSPTVGGGGPTSDPSPDPDPSPSPGDSNTDTSDTPVGYENDPRQDPANWDGDGIPADQEPDDDTAWEDIDVPGIDSGSWITDPGSEQDVARPLMNLESVIRSRLASLSGQDTGTVSLPLIGTVSALVLAVVLAALGWALGGIGE